MNTCERCGEFSGAERLCHACDERELARYRRPAALLGWYLGDGGRILFAPDGRAMCYRPTPGLCKALNDERLTRLRRQRADAAAVTTVD